VSDAPSLLSQLILDVQDLDRSLAFYHGMLHLPITRKDDCDGHRLAFLSSGGVQLLLLQQPKSEQNPLLDRSGGLVINFRVRDLPAFAQSLLQEQVTVLRPLDDPEFGERTCLIADPDGYAVLLSERVETLH
jgi:lactoylglutathione lyase